MSQLTDKTTIYLDARIKKSAQYYALRDNLSLSQIINDQLVEYLEDMADVVAVDEARAEIKQVGTIPFEQVVKDLGLDINEIRRTARSQRQKTAKTTR